jgi:Na+-transporting methylmalonyl-CoA/oxaloacetate decarboxylase gamma subunit
MYNALLITVIGMGLVFIAMLALWGLMALSVRVTARYAENESEEEATEEIGSLQEEPAEADAGLARKRQAAVAAVAYALAQTETVTGGGPMVIAASRRQASAWQAVLRANQLNQRSNLYDRKAGGN